MNLNINWELKVRQVIWKEVAKFPKKDQIKITEVIEKEIVLNPYVGDIEKMEGEENSWRRRVGAYRIFTKFMFKRK